MFWHDMTFCSVSQFKKEKKKNTNYRKKLFEKLIPRILEQIFFVFYNKYFQDILQIAAKKKKNKNLSVKSRIN